MLCSFGMLLSFDGSDVVWKYDNTDVYCIGLLETEKRWCGQMLGMWKVLWHDVLKLIDVMC